MKLEIRIVVAAVIALATIGGEAFTLAERGGKSKCTVVLPGDAGECMRYAADELTNFTARLTGAKVAIADGVPSASARTVRLSVSRSGLAPEAFRISQTGNSVAIEGGNESGVLYGVYELLEKFGGCRWYSSWCEKVPRLDRFEIPDGYRDEQKPAFKLREPEWFDVMKNNAFAARCRVNGPTALLPAKFGGMPYRFGGGLGGCHTFHLILPPEKYFKDHPEYFSEVNGRRTSARTQLCLTNPDVLRIVTSNVLDRIRRHPRTRFYGVSQMDWMNYCACAKCKEIDDYEESHSGTVIRFVNAVAEAVEREFPDVIVETLAYQYSRKPPKHVKPRHNVMPCLCSIECDFSHPMSVSQYRENVRFREDMSGWAKICKQLYVWDYTTNFKHFPMPFPNVLALQDNIRFFRDSKVDFLFEQGAWQGYHGDFAELKTWLISKWMWNPDLPQEGLLDDFFNGYYGKGAPWVRTYFDALHSFHRDTARRPLGCFEPVQTTVIPRGFLGRALELWRRAEVAVADEPETIRRNVRNGAYSVLYALAMRKEGLLDVREGSEKTWNDRLQLMKRTVGAWLKLDKALGGVRLEEGLSASERCKEVARAFVEGNGSFDMLDGGLVVQDSMLDFLTGFIGDYVDDQAASDGRAFRLNPSHYNWCGYFYVDQLTCDPGGRCRAKVRLRLDKKPNAKGEAFWAGVYNPARRFSACEVSCEVDDIRDGYQWYDIGVFEPSESEFVWIGPGRFDKGKFAESPAHNGVFVDCIRIERAK